MFGGRASREECEERECSTNSWWDAQFTKERCESWDFEEQFNNIRVDEENVQTLRCGFEM